MPNAPLCRHIRMGGHHCRAIALQGQALCYAHEKPFLERRRDRLARPSRRPPTPALLAILSTLDDLHLIQRAYGVLLAGLAANTIGLRRANPIFRVLSLASRRAAAHHRDPNHIPATHDADAILRLIQAEPAGS